MTVKSPREVELESTLILIRNKIREQILGGVSQYGADGSQATHISLDVLRRHERQVNWDLQMEINKRITEDGGPEQFKLYYDF